MKSETKSRTKRVSVILALYFGLLGSSVGAASSIGGIGGLLILALALVLGTLASLYTLRPVLTSEVAPPESEPQDFRRKGQRIVRLVIAVMILVALALGNAFQVFAPLLPGMYPEASARRTLDGMTGSLDRILRADSDDELIASYLEYLGWFTVSAQRSRIKAHAKQAGIESDTEEVDLSNYQRYLAIEDILNIAKKFRSNYTPVRVEIETATRQTGRGDDSSQYWFLITRYEGRFMKDDKLHETLIKHFSKSVLEADGTRRQIINDTLLRYYPDANLDEFWNNFPDKQINLLEGDNALEVIGYITGSLGSIDESQLVRGQEWSWESLVLRNDDPQHNSPFSNPWKVNVIVRWGLKRRLED